jgi:Flp pilus assembly protein CpaB
MEMEFKDTGRRRRMVMILVGVVLALAAGYGAFTLAQGNKAAAPVLTESVLVAARDIPARQQIGADDVTVRQVPIDEALPQSYAEAAMVVGRLTAVPVYADQQITPNLFATAAADADYSILQADEEITLTSPYWRAVSVKIPADRAVGGTLTTGQRVDLITTIIFEVFGVDDEGNYQMIETATAEGIKGGPSTKISFQDLEILKADPDEEMYVLKVDLHQAEQIAHLIQEGPDSMALALRPDTDTRIANTLEYGETTDSLIMQYMFRVPRLADLSELLGIPITPTAPTPSGSPDPSASPNPDASPAPSGSPEASPEASPAASAAP